MAEAIRTALQAQTRSRGAIRGRYLDLEAFDNLAPALDLRRLLGETMPASEEEAMAALALGATVHTIGNPNLTINL